MKLLKSASALRQILELAAQIFTIFFVGLMLLLTSFEFFIGASVLALLYLVLIQVTINRKLKRLGAERVRLESVIFRYLIDISNGMLSIRSMGLEDRMASLLAAETRA